MHTSQHDWHTAARPYIADVATYENTHALATYHQDSCQAEYNWIDHKTDICRFSWYITHHTFNPYPVGWQTRHQGVTLDMFASVIVLIIPQFYYNCQVYFQGLRPWRETYIPNLKDWALRPNARKEAAGRVSPKVWQKIEAKLLTLGT